MHPQRQLYIRLGLVRYAWWSVRVAVWVWFVRRGLILPGRWFGLNND